MHNFISKPGRFGAVAIALGLFSLPSNAEVYNIGGYEVNVDTTVSVGISALTDNRRSDYLPESNGGRRDLNTYVNIANPAGDCSTAVYGGFCQVTGNIFNHDGSINSDDGRLNFDKGDVNSAPVKATLDFETRSGNIAAFLRTSMYYDLALMGDRTFERGDLTDKGETNAGRAFDVLDAFVTVDGDVANMPFMVRVGSQVINWGENTFVPGGNSVFNPIDVAALRRPGAEIKDALLPVEAIYGSLAITNDLTLEAYYGGWDEFKLDAGGTLFGPSDTFVMGTNNGNGGQYFIGGGYGSGPAFVCDSDASSAAITAGTGAAQGGANKVIIDAVVAAGYNPCTASPNVDITKKWTTGQAEQERIAAGDQGIRAGADDDGDESYGFALRYYSEFLNSTEFALYYQKADSRLPYISYRTTTPNVIGTSTSHNASTVGRGAWAVGMAGLAGGNLAAGAMAAYNPLYATIGVNDPNGLLEDPTLVATAQSGIRALLGSAGADLGSAGAFDTYTISAASNTLARLQEISFGLSATQVDPTKKSGNAVGAGGLGLTGASAAYDTVGQLPGGATTLAIGSGTGALSLFAEHPEIEVWGLSFNTNILGQTVQGDFSYRPDMPIQIDTDVLTIAALFNNCAFAAGGIVEGAYQSQSTLSDERGQYNTGVNGFATATDPGSPTAVASGGADTIGCRENSYLQGYFDDHDVITWNIGTTSLLAQSNPFVQAVGADVAVLVTDFQGVYVDDMMEKRGQLSTTSGYAPSTNHCVGGSDLPLNGVLSIDDVFKGETFAEKGNIGACRSTDSSWGVTLLGRLTYNNIFGSPINLSPQMVYQMGVEGRSPSPAGFWREDQGSVALSVTADYLGKWQAVLSYRDYLGDMHRNYNLDRNTLSASVSYAF